jgi:glycosyltransferase involved in cell wall biosynthesis
MNDPAPPRSLRILHVFRAPLGGLFRHVVDLAEEQAARGHEVGLFFDTVARGDHVARALSRLSRALSLGVWGCPIPRNPSPKDVVAMVRLGAVIRRLRPDVVHGHGSKGGLYARFPALAQPQAGPVRAYTPHGGSFNFPAGRLAKPLYMATERLLTRATDVLLFESAYIAGRFDAQVGVATGLRRIVANGLGAGEFTPIAPDPDAADFLYVGELRAAKGIDTLMEALARVGARRGAVPTAVLVGSGPDEAVLRALARRLGVVEAVAFAGPLPAREAFRKGRVIVVPSRAESLPYIVLEAAAARMPMVATDVGGIPEIFGPYRDRLGPCDDPENLGARMLAALGRPRPEQEREAAELAGFVAGRFSIRTMVDAVLEGYCEAIARRARRGSPRALSGLPSSA